MRPPTLIATLAALLLTPTAAGAHPLLTSQAITAATIPYTPTAAPLLHPRLPSNTSGPQPCATLSNDAESDGDGYTANQVADAYSLTPYYQAGDTGAGQTIAVLELEPNLSSDIAAFQTCYGTTTTVNYTQIDGGAGTGAGSGEAALDIEQIIATAPGATIDVYQAPNTTSGVQDAITAMIASGASIISDSWGTCEANLPAGFAAVENTLFQQAAEHRISVLAASGDNGSTDCGTSSLAVDDPASQPNVTGVGGTTMTSGNPSAQVAWNGSAAHDGATGGGLSNTWPLPTWQQTAAGDLGSSNPCGYATPTSLTAGGTAITNPCRAVPDVSADADPDTGYWFIHTNPASGNLQAQLLGGTSAAAPLWAGMIALINSSAACNSHALGPLNPLLYTAANTAGAFTDIASGNNNYTPNGLTGTTWAATAGYDPATGLGTPIATTLGTILCAENDAVSFTQQPANLNATAGAAANQQVAAQDIDQHTINYTAINLPAGENINPTTGLITGTPSHAGSGTATITATAASNGADSSISIPWTITCNAGGCASTSPSPGATTSTPSISTPTAPATTSSTPTNTAATGQAASGQEDDGAGEPPQAIGKPAKAATPRAILLNRRYAGHNIHISIPADRGQNLTRIQITYSTTAVKPTRSTLQTVQLATQVPQHGHNNTLTTSSNRANHTLTLKLPTRSSRNPELKITYTTPATKHHTAQTDTLIVQLAHALTQARKRA